MLAGIECALHFTRAVHQRELHKLVDSQTIQFFYKVAELAKGPITQYTRFFHERYRVHQGKRVLFDFLEGLFAELLGDSPELGVLDFVGETESEQNLRLGITHHNICAVLLVPLSHVKNELVYDRVIVGVLTEGHRTIFEKGFVHKACQRVER